MGAGVEKDHQTTRHPGFEVVFEEDDPENPINWPGWYRAWTVATVAFSAWVVAEP